MRACNASEHEDRFLVTKGGSFVVQTHVRCFSVMIVLLRNKRRKENFLASSRTEIFVKRVVDNVQEDENPGTIDIATAMQILRLG